uniref:Large ribosomal subunit protein uL6c n=1 Tax=Spyridia filamentosa TaxID=196632 RepID=A0A1Z1MK94_SPYFI|nr:ribosomal protein L6 [Spyridia filamentosa]ARW66262.1 ribosomal protein L6 [Spyridia filamentosa]
MSRIGKKHIILTKETKVHLEDQKIKITGPKGELSYIVPESIQVKAENNTIILRKKHESKTAQQLHGLSRSIINNIVIGVNQGFEKRLAMQGVGYRCQMENEKLILNVGYSHPVTIIPPKDINIKVEKNGNILVSGINKEIVGEIAAKIRSVRPPEPYKGKGIRYVDENVQRKVGKAGK